MRPHRQRCGNKWHKNVINSIEYVLGQDTNGDRTVKNDQVIFSLKRLQYFPQLLF